MNMYGVCPVMMNARNVSILISISLVITSVSLMFVEQEATTESWAILLLTPFPIAFALSRSQVSHNVEDVEVPIWNEDEVESSEEGIGDPIEAGFDVPVL